MHQNIGVFPSLLDETISFIEVPVQLIFLAVLGWNVKIMGDIFFAVMEKSTPGYAEDCFDVERCLEKGIHCRSLRSSAA